MQNPERVNLGNQEFSQISRRSSFVLPQSYRSLTSIKLDNRMRRRASMQVPKQQTEDKPHDQAHKLRQVFGNGLISLFTRRKQKALNSYLVDSEVSRQKLKVEKMIKASQQVSEEQRLNKAVRHFFDAYHIRQARNDLELNPNILIKIFYTIQVHPLWHLWLFSLTLSYMALSFIEPANHLDNYTFDNTAITFPVETTIIIFFLLDLFFEVTHLYYDDDRPHSIKYLNNKTLIIKTLIDIVIVFDYISHFSSGVRIRYGRCLRPFLMFLYDRELRRSIKSILNSMQEIVQLMLFVIIMSVFWALVGLKIIGNLDGAPYDEYSQNFSNMWTSFFIMYALTSPDGYPESIIPAYNNSRYYLAYFLPYIILYQLLFVPIPVAIVFEAYRNNSCKLVIMDRLKQREALLACFIALDTRSQKLLDKEIVHKLMVKVYLDKKAQVKRIPILLNLMEDQDGKICLQDFFEIIEHIENDPMFGIPFFPDSQIWDLIRNTLNKLFKLKIIASSVAFEIGMFLFVIFNSAIVLSSMLVYDPDVLYVLGVIDDACIYVYSVECCIKIIGLGITKYFSDDWNKFDFVMVGISLASSFFQSLLYFLKGARQLKSSKLIRLTKLNKMFRAFRALRTIKVMNFLLVGADTLIQLKVMVQRIMTCIPLVFKMIPIIWMLVYLWAIIGMEYFNKYTVQHHQESKKQHNRYEFLEYADFTDFGGALLILLQVSLETEWNKVVYDYAYQFKDFIGVMIYFVTYHMLMGLIILSIVKGIIWEIFMIVEQAQKEQEQLLELEDENEVQEEQMIKNYKPRKMGELEQIIMNQHLENKLMDEKKYEKILQNLSYGNLSSIHTERDIDQLHQMKISKANNAKSISRKDSNSQSPLQQLERINSTPKSGMKSLKQVGYATFNNDSVVDEQKSIGFNINVNAHNAYVFVNNNQSNHDSKSVKFGESSENPQLSAPKPTPVANKRKSILVNGGGQDELKSISQFSHKNNRRVSIMVREQSNPSHPIPSHQQSVMGELSRMNYNMEEEDSMSASQSSQSFMQSSKTFFQGELIISYLNEKLLTKGQIFQLMNADDLIDEKVPTSIDKFMETIKKTLVIIPVNDESKRRATSSQAYSSQNETSEGLNQKSVYKKALMRETNIKRLKQIEKDYFRTIYDGMSNIQKVDELSPLLKFQAVQIQALDMCLRYHTTNYNSQLMLINQIENNISMNLLPRGSFIKFVYQDSLGNWFYLCLNQNGYLTPQLAGQGIWELHEEILNDRILVGLDFFSPTQESSVNETFEKYFDSLSLLQSGIPSAELKLDYLSSIVYLISNIFSDLVIFQAEERDQIFIEQKTAKLINEGQDIEKVPIRAQRVMAILLNYQGDTQSVEKHNQRRKTLLDDQTSPERLRKTIRQLDIEKLKKRNTWQEESENDDHLPIPLVIEMMESINQVINSRVDNLLIKISQLINTKALRLKQNSL